MIQCDRLLRSPTSFWGLWTVFLLEPLCWQAELFLECSCGHAVVLVQILLMTGLLNGVNPFLVTMFMINCSAMVLLDVTPSRCVPQYLKNADGAAGGSGAQQAASFAGGGGGAEGCAHGIPSAVLPLRADRGGLLAAAAVSGLARERSALQVASSARGRAAESAQLGGAGASRLRRQARSRCLDFVGLSDLFHFPGLVGARVCHMNSSFDTHHARANSWGTLHAARINSGSHVNSYQCTYNSCGGVRGGTKPRSMSTRGQVGCSSVEKLASLQQAPGRLHVET